MLPRICRVVPMSLVLPGAILLAVSASPLRAEDATPGNLSDLCPTVDARDTIETVRSRVAARLGEPIKEETLETQYVITFRQKDGSKLFVILTRDNDKLEVSCYAGKS